MKLKHFALASAIALSIGAFGAAAWSQTPVHADYSAPIPAPQDVAFPGEITLDVDATDVGRGIFRIHEVVPVAGSGPMTLLYPRWLPGKHGPRGQIEKVAGLTITANGQPVAWRRDPGDVYAFHVDPPAGAAALDITFQFLSSTDTAQGSIVMTPGLLNLEWEGLVLYPAGYYASRINVAPSARLPEGWSFATALDGDTTGAAPHFQSVDLATLADSPMFAGRYYRRVELDTTGRSRVSLNIFADRPDQLLGTDAQIEAHRNLVHQADLLYGARHFNHYDFLFALSDHLGGIGLEHQRSSQNGVPGNYFTDWNNTSSRRDLLPHEMTHSWNGKYRRPADLWTPNFNVPMQDSLLWVYEGQTQYWGYVLAGRSGLLTKQEALDSLALTAAAYDTRVGRTWRPLVDTTNDPIISPRAPQAWRSWQRSEDYYSEGQLIWLEADTLIRERTNNRKSLDDFARAFFGVNDGQWQAPDTYTFDDVVAALNGVMPYDWAGFLHERVDAIAPHAPLDGLARGGYRLVYNETRSPYLSAQETHRKFASFTYSIGLSVGEGAVVNDVQWDGPAFNAGVTRGAKILAVNGVGYEAEGLRRAITNAKTDTQPIQLLLQDGDRYWTVSIDYHGGLRYPHLERIAGTPDRLSAIYAPRRR
ncbi:MAG TPA: peptidase M61 [Caulobacterales bacterium]|nr:peptidase M61 [Caulobacterales bacterium]